MIDFPSSPSVGQIFNSGTGPVYIWDGVAWSLTVPSIVPAWEPIATADLAGLSSKVFSGLDAFRRLRLTLEFAPSNTAIAFIQVSADNGATFVSTSSYLNAAFIQSSTVLSGIGPGANTSILLSDVTIDAGATLSFNGNIEVDYFNKPALSFFKQDSVMVVSAAIRREWMYGYYNSAVALNAFKLSINAGTFTTGYALLEGIRG